MSKRKSLRPDGRSEKEIGLRTIVIGWDLWVSIALGAALFAYAALSGTFVGGRVYFFTSVPLCTALSLGAWVAGRWMFERMSNDDYGALLRLVDPRQVAVLFPFHAVAVVGLLAALWAGLSAIVLDAVTSTVLRALLYSVSLSLTAWTLLGCFSLYRISDRHMRRASEIISMREDLDAEERRRRAAPEKEESDQLD